MKKLLILAIVTILLVLSGCTKNNTSSGDISSADNILNASQIEETESTTSENNNNVNSTTSTSEVTSTVSDSSKVESKPAPTTKPAETSSTTPTTPSKPAESQKPAESKPSESKPAEPQYKTIQLYTATTYYGFTGYFSNYQGTGDIKLTELGIGDNSKFSKGVTEYYNIDDDSPIWFVFSLEQGVNRELAWKLDDDNKVRFTTGVKVAQ